MEEIIQYIKSLDIDYRVINDEVVTYVGFYYWFGVTQEMINRDGVEKVKRNIYNNLQH